MTRTLWALYVSTPRYGVHTITLHATEAEAHLALAEYAEHDEDPDFYLCEVEVPQ